MERCISRARETLADARWADQVAAFKAAVMAHDGADFFYLEEDEFLAFLEEYEAERR